MTKSAYDSALRLLARREHSAKELADKLKQRHFVPEEIQQALIKCQQFNYQSDERFAEQLYNVRVRQGYGPLRIQQELQAKGIDTNLSDAVLQQESTDIWAQRAHAVMMKKFSEEQTSAWDDWQKCVRFLMYRGFPMELIMALRNSQQKIRCE